MLCLLNKVQRSIAFLGVVLFLINQVSARKCYMCLSDLNKDCLTNPKQSKFEIKCQWFEGNVLNNMGSSPLLSTMFKDLDGAESQAIDFDCVTANFTTIRNAKNALVRGCVPRFLTDESVKVIDLLGGFQIDLIRRCGSDLCNAN